MGVSVPGLGRRVGAAAALAACVVGCGSSGGWTSSYDGYERQFAYDWRGSASSSVERRDAPPDHGLTDAEVAAALAAEQRAPLTEPHGAAAPRADVPVEQAAAEVAASYRRGDREAARALVAAHPGLVDWSDPGVVVSCRYAGGELGLELMVVRADASLGATRESLAVCFAPGTFGIPSGIPSGVPSGASSEPGPGETGLYAGRGDRWTSPDSERRFGTWPAPQDLALLRAPVLVIPAGEAMTVAYVPVACASFHRGAPDAGTPYTLSRFPEGSRVDRLMSVLCQGEDAPPDAEAQLAVWLARDDVSWADFVAQGGDRGRLVTFGRSRSVRASHAPGAARLLLEAGVDPRPLRFFDPTGGEAPVAPAPPPPAREPEEPAAPADPTQVGSQLS